MPIAKIRQSLDAIRDQAAFLVKPGNKVKLTLDLKDNPYGKAENVKFSIEKAFTERLSDEGLEVSDDGLTILAIDCKPMSLKVLSQIKPSLPIRVSGVPKDNGVPREGVVFRMKWKDNEGKRTFFEEGFYLESYMFAGQGEGKEQDEKDRMNVYHRLKLSLQAIPFPDFVPAEQSMVSLPFVTDSELTVTETAADPVKAKIDAKKKKMKR